ncbi:hypothetical protein B0H14DRAFT_2649332 [Mycena olivaceomarginata]|nr:hypothetical protein B0H14DRAFT_2649332 [Mycena olivaceomarginata]
MSHTQPLRSFVELSTRDDQAIADESDYGYTPQEAITILFLVLDGISTSYDFLFPSFDSTDHPSIPVLHVGQATYFRMWWLFPTAVLCGLGELIGWSGRLWSSLVSTADTPFTIQLVPTSG